MGFSDSSEFDKGNQMNTQSYMQKAKAKLGIQSDYALAQHLGLTRSAVSKLQLGKTSMGDETALKIADILQISRAVVLANAHAEREKNPEVAAVWQAMVEKFSMGFNALISAGFPRQIRVLTR